MQVVFQDFISLVWLRCLIGEQLKVSLLYEHTPVYLMEVYVTMVVQVAVVVACICDITACSTRCRSVILMAPLFQGGG